jgi:hypothetical protein
MSILNKEAETFDAIEFLEKEEINKSYCLNFILETTFATKLNVKFYEDRIKRSVIYLKY